MNKEQSNHFKMFVATQSLLDNNSPVWQGIPRAVNYKNEMDELISRISEKAQQSNLNVTVTHQKEDLKEIIASKVSALSSVLQVIALEKQNKDLANFVKLSKSDVIRMRETDIDSSTRKICDAAKKELPTLAEFGIPEQNITEILTSLEEYNALIGKPRTILSQKYATLGTIEELFAKTNELLKLKMDALMLIFRDTQPEFYNGYVSTRSIIGN